VREGASLVAPILIGLGALAAAILTAITANRRLRRQLAHDRELHSDLMKTDRELREKQLEHDRELREKQLEHDREIHQGRLDHERMLRYREHVQQLLDSLLGEVQDLTLDLHQYAASVLETPLGEPSDGQEKGSSKQRDLGLLEESTSIYRSVIKLRTSALQLGLRLGQHAEIFTTLTALSTAIGKRLKNLGADHEADWAAKKSKDQMLGEDVDAREQAFFLACAAWYFHPVTEQPIESGPS
jgi:hypothetical protein